MYSVLEVGAYFLPALRRQTWLFSVKAFLLFVGVLGAFAALVTGGIAEELVEGGARSYILEVHAPVSAITTALYFVIAAAYLIRIFDAKGWGNYVAGVNSPFMRVWSIKKYIAHLVLDTWFLPVLAILALAGMFVTGALGAALVYGPDADPFVSFVYSLFWAQ